MPWRNFTRHRQANVAPTRETPSKFRPKSSPSRGCLVAGGCVPKDSFTGMRPNPKALLQPTGPRADWRWLDLTFPLDRCQRSCTLPCGPVLSHFAQKGRPLRASAVPSNEPEGSFFGSTYLSNVVATRRWFQPFERLSRCRDSNTDPKASPVARRFQVVGALCGSPRFEQDEK